MARLRFVMLIKIFATPPFPQSFYETYQACKHFPLTSASLQVKPSIKGLTPPLSQVTGEVDYLSFIAPVL